MKTGDKVVYIQKTLTDIGLIKGQVYTIVATAECGGCDDGLHIDVGLNHDGKFVVCDICVNIVSIGDEYFLHNSGFRLLEDEFIERHLARIKEITASLKQLK